jgi:hypothetical protein
MPAAALLGKRLVQEIKQERLEILDNILPDGYVASLIAPGLMPVRQVRANCSRAGASSWIMPGWLTLLCVLPMLLTRLLNTSHHFPGFVYEGARPIDT